MKCPIDGRDCTPGANTDCNLLDFCQAREAREEEENALADSYRREIKFDS